MERENLYTANCIRTFTGIYMNVFAPSLEMICIEDIAHALSNQCRFGGHLPKFYSVAQHSVIMSEKINNRHRLAALLHDASEAYLLDMPRPIKQGLSNYKELEGMLMKVIAKKFGFDYPLHEKIKEIDEYMLEWEWSNLMLGEKNLFPDIDCWPPTYAKAQFIEAFKNLRA